MTNEDITKRLQRLERLTDISRSLGKSQNLDELLNQVVQAACELLDSEISVILLYEEETDLLKFVAGPSAYKEAMKRIRMPLEKSVAGWAYKQSKPIHIANLRNDPRVSLEIENALGYNVRAILAVPLIFKGETIGIIEAVNKHNNAHYTGEDVTILETLASQAAVVTLSTLLLEETKRAYDELEELERIKANFIAIAAHELRTPLGLILGHATFLSDALKEEQYRHQMEVIIRSATRLKKIIEDLSNVSNVQSGVARVRRKPVSMNAVILRTVNTHQDMARRKRINLTAKLPENNLVVEGDEEKIAIALDNVIANAITFTNEHGHVVVTAENLPGYVKISVIDDGVGIPAKDLGRVFDRFFQVQSHLTRRHGGMGLGLSVSKAMIELHGGQIWVDSVESKGSNFSILLPTNATKSTPSVFTEE